MTLLRKAPRPEAKQIEFGQELSTQNISTILRTAEGDPAINVHANVYEYIGLYKEKGIDLNGWYKEHAHTRHQEEIVDAFLQNKKHGFAAELAEILPLFANAQGRLGPYLKVKVTKTAKPDDQGNAFIDLVIEVENTWLVTEAPTSLRDVPSKMTFLIDMTTAVGSEVLEKKIKALRDIFLLYGEKANVKCYKNKFGDLGIERPKIIVAKQADYMEKVGASLGGLVSHLAADKFSISKPEKFNEQYQAYFLDLMLAVGENANENANYMKNLDPNHQKRKFLIKEYEKIAAFVEAYKKTPMTLKQDA